MSNFVKICDVTYFVELFISLWVIQLFFYEVIWQYLYWFLIYHKKRNDSLEIQAVYIEISLASWNLPIEPK